MPEGYAALAFSCALPRDWVRVPIPAEEHDLSNPAVFIPLLVVSSPNAAVFFTIAARPKYEDGSVEDWAQYLSTLNNLRVERMQEARIHRAPCVLSDAVMESEVGPMRSRSVFLEDGGRLFNIGALAPDALWASVEATLSRMIGSFRLETTHGISAAPMREMRAGETVDLSAIAESNTAQAAAPEAVVEPEAVQEAAVSEEPDPALADDASSLDPDHTMNVQMRDSRAGLTVRVHSVDLQTKRAIVGAGAIESLIRVPLGWHVIDDGRRTLVFDEDGQMQISLNLRDGGPDDHFAILNGIGDEMAAANPTAEFLKMMLMGLPCLAIRKLPVGNELLQQAYLARASQRPDMTLVCRVTSNDENMSRAINAAEVILMSYGDVQL